MKRTYYPSLLRISLLACVACLISAARVQACVNPDSSVICIVTYDTIFSEVEVRVTHMLMAESPTRICTLEPVFATLDSTISDQITSSIQPLLLHDAFSIYPNPIMQEKFEISYTLLQQSTIRISMYDGVGRRIGILYEGIQKAGLHEAKLAVPESALAHPDLYLLQIESGETVISRKLIVSP